MLTIEMPFEVLVKIRSQYASTIGKVHVSESTVLTIETLLVSLTIGSITSLEYHRGSIQTVNATALAAVQIPVHRCQLANSL